jgi:hypothetical protein
MDGILLSWDAVCGRGRHLPRAACVTGGCTASPRHGQRKWKAVAKSGGYSA